MMQQKKLALGVLAHVDAGKTTLTEAMLYESGALKKLGRVDHGNAFLDTDVLERERGITIFSKQAVLSLPGASITLLDTPGHVDFSGEMERTLQVLDYAVLVISGTDGVQGHTHTLWKLLERYHVPTFLFINKMDLPGAQASVVLEQLQHQLNTACVDFGGEQDALMEQIALCDEAALEQFLESGAVAQEHICRLIAQRRVFPCFFGAALRLEGVQQLLDALVQYTQMPEYPAAFGARIYKIARDAQGSRLTYLKVTGGRLRVRDLLTNRQPGIAQEDCWEEKVSQVRIYSGARYQTVEEVEAGSLCAVTGLSRSKVGEGLGVEQAPQQPALEPVLTYQVLLPEGCDPHTALQKLSQLEEEDPQLHIVWNEQLQEIHIQLMGEVQMEILRSRIAERFGLQVGFGAGNIVYRETITEAVEGVGHFEPLRHYAEVHLLLEPLPRGSGLQFDTACSEDQLDRSWQRLVLTHLEERTHPGVLIGAPITDMRITLIAGRAHVKHTEGGDFRQATYRAVRHGLMSTKSQLLEPWYSCRLELPSEYVGRAMSDLQRMSGSFQPPEVLGELTVLNGSAPVAALREYAVEVASYTRGRGRLTCTFQGYAPCHNAEEVIAQSGYDPARDLENPADSVFCSYGAGQLVPWQEVWDHAHLESPLQPKRDTMPQAAAVSRDAGGSAYRGTLEQDRELMAIFERTYGEIKPRSFYAQRELSQRERTGERVTLAAPDNSPEYLLVDGYNIIFAWEDLKKAAQSHLDTARSMLINLLSNYAAVRQCHVILVFDAYRVAGSPGSVEQIHGIHVVYTKEAETADAYIEKTTYDLAKKHRVRVATSDSAEQMIILGHGALRVSAEGFRAEVEQVNAQIAQRLQRNPLKERSYAVRTALEKELNKK